MFGFTAFDILVSAAVLVSLVVGFSRGFTSEVLKLVAWAGAIFLTIIGLPIATDFMQAIIPVVFIANIAAMVVSFSVSIFFLSFLAKFVGDRIRTSFVGPLDRALGAFFGVARGVLIISAIFLMYGKFVTEEDQGQWIQDARFKGFVTMGAATLEDITPELFQEAKSLGGQAVSEETSAILDDMKVSMPTGEEAAEAALDYTREQRDQLEGLIEDVGAEDTEDTEENGDDEAGG